MFARRGLKVHGELTPGVECTPCGQPARSNKGLNSFSSENEPGVGLHFSSARRGWGRESCPVVSPATVGACLPYHPPMVPSGVPEGGPLTRGAGTEVPGPSFLGVGAGGRNRCSCVPVRSVSGVVPPRLPVLLAFFFQRWGPVLLNSLHQASVQVARAR